MKEGITLFIPDGLEWNGKTEGFFVEWLSYFVLFNDRFSFAIQALTPTLFCRRPNSACPNCANRYIEGYPKENKEQIVTLKDIRRKISYGFY